MSLMAIAAVLACAFALIAAIPALVVLGEVIAATFAVDPLVASPQRLEPDNSAAGKQRAGKLELGNLEFRNTKLAILMPAHNEQGGIALSVACALAQIQDNDRLLVVADNCSDNTAAIANAAGAVVIERSDSSHRGKGYALDFGIAHLRHDPPDVVLILDADCVIEAGSVKVLVAECLRFNRPVQACYLMSFPADVNDFGSRLAQFAFLVKNRVRPLGLTQLGMPCQLLGTGMAFPWHVIDHAPLATGHIVEDMKLGVDLTTMGFAAQFIDRARVNSTFPLSSDGTASQRKRWEHGHLQVLIGEVPRLLLSAIKRLDLPSLALALDLAVPPLALLAMLQVLAVAATLACYLLTGVVLPLMTALLGLAALLVAVSLAWRRFGRDTISLATLAKAPLYALRKLPVYFGFVAARQTDWVRSRRDHE